jgi:hypothetical protein
MDVDSMLSRTLLADMGLVAPNQAGSGKGGLTADGLKQMMAAEHASGKVHPSAALPKSKSVV